VKIAVIANTGWYLWNFRRPLMAALRAQGHEVLALSPPDDHVQRLQAEGHAWRALRLDAASINPFAELATVWRLRRQLRAAGVQLLLTYTPKVNIDSGLAAMGTGIVHVPNVSGLGRVFIQRSALTPLVVRLYRLAFGRAFRVVFQNGDDADAFRQLGLVRPDQVVRVPGSGVDVDRFRPGPMPPDGGSAPVFLFVGRLLRDKGAVEFVEAACRVRAVLPGARFRLLGASGSDNPSAIGAAELAAWRAEGVVELLGAVDDVRPHLAAAHCVVLPSYREGVPRALLEAAAMARPCIATDVPGCRDAVEDGVNGLLCPARDAAALAAAMQRFAAAGTAQQALWGEAGRRRAETRFDERIVLATYGEIVGAAPVSGSAPPPSP
jgi:glycosyltransferase involved in cell wall biosynthesis